MPGDEEVDFFEQMMAAGVRPLGKGKGEPAPGSGPAAPPPGPPRSPGLPRPPAPPRPTARPPAPPPPPPPALVAELAGLRVALAEVEQRLAQVEQESAGWQEQTELARGDIDLLEERLRKTEAERDGIDARRRDQEERLKQAEGALAEATAFVGLEQVLRDRGLAKPAEDQAALAGLVELRGAELVGAAELGPTAALVRLLEERLALVCSRESCSPDGDVVAVRVPPGRCEMCGGSDIRAAFERFSEAAERCGIEALVVVGGSPAYRRQLRALADKTRSPIRLDLVSGTTRRPRHKVEADMRRAQLVVIWGATLLDHSVSVAYRGGPARVLKVPERGITRMLDAVRRDVLAAAREATRGD